MTHVLIQFHIRHRGSVWVELRTKDGVAAGRIAVSAVTHAVDLFNKQWPGARRDELEFVGMSDGRVMLNAKGERHYRAGGALAVTEGDPNRRRRVSLR